MAPSVIYAVGIEMTRAMYKDQDRQPKPLIYEYEKDDFDQRIAFAMENNFAVNLTLWSDGFTVNITGSIHKVDPITHQLRIEVNPGEFERIAFEDVIGVALID